MKKILIVDDDDLFRSKCREFLLAEKASPFLLREAADSQKAIQLIEQEMPDLVLTDMDMPGVNGVELIRFLKERYPSMVILAVSAYEDYEYVRSSLTLGAKDYLLKHQLTPQLFFQVLQDAVGPVESQIDGLCPLPSRADRIRQMLLNLREEAAAQDLLGRYCLQQEGAVACASILCRLKRTVPPHAKIRDKRFLAQSVDAVLKGVLSSYPFADLVRFNDEEAFLFFDRQAAVSRKAAGKEIEKILALLRHKAELLLNVSIFFGVSHIFSGPGRYARSQAEARHALRNCFFSPEGGIYYPSALSQESAVLPDKESLSGLKLSLCQRNTEESLERIESYFCDIQKSKPPYYRIQLFCHSLLQTLEEGLGLDQAYDPQSLPFEKKESETDLVQIRLWFEELIRHAAGAQHAPGISAATKEAVAYIRTHYAENISLKDAAKEIGFNPSYLSRVFGEDTGQSFISFLNAYRIQKACALLQNGAGKIPLLAVAQQSGFGSYNHFWNMFKKITGFSPEHYAKNGKNSE